MTKARNRAVQDGEQFPAPLPADYADEVGEEAIARIKEHVKDELPDLKKLYVMSGPAW